MQFLLPNLECFFKNDALSYFDQISFFFEVDDSVVHILAVFGLFSLSRGNSSV